MKVILNRDIPNLGEEGEIKDVARGYARNFLIPNELVMPYSRDALAILESRREQLEQRREEKRKAALDVKTRLETEDLVIEMPAGERGRLFGSVTSATIADALASRGINLERKRLDIPEKTIKTVGTTKVHVRLYGEEEADLKVVVRASGEAPPAEEATAAEEDAPTADETTAVADESPAASAEGASAEAEAPADAGEAAAEAGESAADSAAEDTSADSEEAAVEEVDKD